jgi:photosynthetic reaction center cytochrome c subunit
MRRLPIFALVGALLVVSAPRLAAQGAPRKFSNLQVFPPDTPADVLTAAMKNFTRALGVRCQFCHVGEEGMPLEKFDFASDSNPHKQIARGMMRLTADINGQVTKAMPNAPARGYQVTCWTCHRGAEHPQHTPDAAKPPGR